MPSVLGADSVVEPIRPNVNEGFGLKVEQAASDDSAEEDAMVVSTDLAGDHDIKVGHRSGEYRPTLGIVVERKTLERVRVWGEPATEMPDQCLTSRGKLIQGESAAGFDPVSDKTVMLDRDGQHRWFKARLLDPASEHPRGPVALADGENIEAAGDSAQRLAQASPFGTQVIRHGDFGLFGV